MGNPLTKTTQLPFAPRENFVDVDDMLGRSERKAPYTQRVCGDGQRRNITGGMTVRTGDCDSFEAVDDSLCEINHPMDVEDAMIAMIDDQRKSERQSRGKMPSSTPKERAAHERTIERKRQRRERMRAHKTGAVVLRRGTAA